LIQKTEVVEAPENQEVRETATENFIDSIIRLTNEFETAKRKIGEQNDYIEALETTNENLEAENRTIKELQAENKALKESLAHAGREERRLTEALARVNELTGSPN